MVPPPLMRGQLIPEPMLHLVVCALSVVARELMSGLIFATEQTKSFRRHEGMFDEKCEVNFF